MFSAVISALVIATLFAVTVAQSSEFCGFTTVWRNSNATCPVRAVCADVMKQTRDWRNGTKCNETRTLHNCICPGGNVCPTTNDAHMYYASRTHKRYTCEPMCDVPYCGNARRTGRQPDAVVEEINSPEFEYRSFYRMKCRCPRHHTPANGPGVRRSTRFSRSSVNFQWSNTVRHFYVCNGYPRSRNFADPCGN